MGWASGGRIFDNVAYALTRAKASDEIKRDCLGPLIDALQDEDWDTEHDSLEAFADDPVIVDLFAEHGVTFGGEDDDD